MMYDSLVVGGGVVGMSLANGLCQQGERVGLVDGGDCAYRASRGNFGLVWVQGKGSGHPDYARWSMEAARVWPSFAADLKNCSGTDVELSQPGGLYVALSECELTQRMQLLNQVRIEVGGSYEFELLDSIRLKKLVPQIGPAVAGAVLCPMDGHVNPLKLLRALFQAFVRRGGHIASGIHVESIKPLPGGGFRLVASDCELESTKVVLASGLGNQKLAPMVGLRACVRPVRGQILVTERVRPFLHHPTMHVRQTDEGAVQIGDSKEEAGFDDGTTLKELSRIAGHAVRCFPALAGVNIMRAWGALRVMSPDGLPIYEASRKCLGAFIVTCHSGITLAPLHAGIVARWIGGGDVPQEIGTFTSDRFNVQIH